MILYKRPAICGNLELVRKRVVKRVRPVYSADQASLYQRAKQVAEFVLSLSSREWIIEVEHYIQLLARKLRPELKGSQQEKLFLGYPVRW